MTSFELGMLSVKAAADPGFSGFANSAIQSPLGQRALGAVAGGYNALPQSVRGNVSNFMLSGNSPYNPTGLNQTTPRFTPAPGNPVHVKTQTTATNDKITQDRGRQLLAGTAGAPMHQLGYGLAHGQLPTRTFAQGTPVMEKTVFNNDRITQNQLVPATPRRQALVGGIR